MVAPEWFQYDVSRETLDRLEEFTTLIRKWTPRINLIARSTVNEVEERHIWDSAQVFQPRNGRWIDLGSGGGLPGVVVAVLLKDQGIENTVTLVESDQRKATFLRTCARELGVPFEVVSKRIEEMNKIDAATISARALAPLNTLLDLATPHLSSDGVCLFQKGARWKAELKDAQENWRFSYEVMQSKTQPEAVILEIRNVSRV